MSGDGGTTPSFPYASNDTTPASLARSGHMRRWAVPSATIGGFVTTGLGSQQRLGVALATTSVAGALSAADKAKLDGLTTDTGWLDLGTVATYQSGWGVAPYGNQYRAMIRRTPDGWGHLRGLVYKATAVAAGEAILTLPTGWGCGDTGHAGAGTQTIFASTSNDVFCCLELNGSTLNARSGCSGAWVSLANVHWNTLV